MVPMDSVRFTTIRAMVTIGSDEAKFLYRPPRSPESALNKV